MVIRFTANPTLAQIWYIYAHARSKVHATHAYIIYILGTGNARQSIKSVARDFGGSPFWWETPHTVVSCACTILTIKRRSQGCLPCHSYMYRLGDLYVIYTPRATGPRLCKSRRDRHQVTCTMGYVTNYTLRLS